MITYNMSDYKILIRFISFLKSYVIQTKENNDVGKWGREASTT